MLLRHYPRGFGRYGDGLPVVVTVARGNDRGRSRLAVTVVASAIG